MTVQSDKTSYVQTSFAIIILAAAAWVAYEIYEQYQIPQQLAQSAVRDSVREAADEARDVAQQVLVGRPPNAADHDRKDAKPGALLGRVLGLGMDLGHELSKVANDTLDEIAGLTTEEEREIGRQVHEMICANHTVAVSTQEVSRLERLAQPFLSIRQRQEIDFHFAIIEEESVNAFAHVGGYVYVNRGLLNTISSDDELRFVIGHEIAHGDLRHCAKSMTAVVRAQQMGGEAVGALTSVAYQAIARGYSEDQEFEADAWSYEQMRHLGRSHQQALAGLRMLERHFGSEQHSHDQQTPRAIEYIDDHLRTHPSVADRIARLEDKPRHQAMSRK